MSDSENRSLALGTVSVSLAILLGQAVNGIAFIVLARRVGPSEFGRFAVVYGISLALGGILDFGSSQRVTRELAAGGDRSGFRSWLAHRAALQVPVVAIAGCIAYVTVLRDAPVLLGVVMLQAVTMPWAQGVLGATRALRSPLLPAWFVLFGNVLLLVAAASAPAGSVLTAASIAVPATWLASGWAAVVSLGPVWKDLGATSRREWPWRGAAAFGLFGVAVGLQSFDVVVLKAVAGATESGEYAAVSKWIQPMLVGATAFTSYVFPLLAATDVAGARRLVRRSVPVLLLGVGAAVGLALCAPWLVASLLGDEYAGSGPLLQLLCLGCIPVILSQPLVAFLQAQGQERYVAAVSASSTALILGVTLVLGSALGAESIAVGWMCAFAAQVGLFAVRYRSVGALSRSEP